MIVIGQKLINKTIIFMVLCASFLFSELVFANDIISVWDRNNGIEIKNISKQFIRVRVSFSIPLSRKGYIGVCNPYGLAGNKEVPDPNAKLTEFDKPMLSGQILWVPNNVCGSYVGYSVWARDDAGNLLDQIHK